VRQLGRLFITWGFLCLSISIQAQDVLLGPLKAGDALRVIVSKDTEPILGGQITTFNLRVVVATHGTIFVPFLGSVRASGMSIPELDQDLRSRYAEYFRIASQAFKPSLPPRVTLLYLGDKKTGLDKTIDQIGKQLATR
jgi:protein involved in polysaccharide export with SLBB domain